MKQRKVLKQEESVIHPSDLDGNGLILAMTGDEIPLVVPLRQDKLKIGSVVFCKLGNEQFGTGKYYELTNKHYVTIDEGPVEYTWENSELAELGVPGLFLQKATTLTFEEGVQYYMRNLNEFTPMNPVIGNYVSSNVYEDSIHFKIVKSPMNGIQNVMLWWCDPINIISTDLEEACVWSKTQVIRIPSNIVTREKLDQLIASTSPIDLGLVVGGSTIRDQYAYDPNKQAPCFVDTIPCGESNNSFTSVYYVLSAISRYGVCHHEFITEVETI